MKTAAIIPTSEMSEWKEKDELESQLPNAAWKAECLDCAWVSSDLGMEHLSLGLAWKH